MTLGIMQPYLFPYLGYLQLIKAVDRYVVYDDVTYIKGGWINRNNLLGQGGKKIPFTMPLSGAGSHVRICDVSIDVKQYPYFRKKFLKTLTQTYQKAPHFETTNQLIVEILDFESRNLSEFLGNSLRKIATHAGIEVDWVMHSSGFQNDHLKAQERVLDICRQSGATRYINAIGGMELYDRPSFRDKGIALNFLQPDLKPYQQFGPDFVPYLSVIDVLMFNDISTIQRMLDSYRLI